MTWPCNATDLKSVEAWGAFRNRIELSWRPFIPDKHVQAMDRVSIRRNRDSSTVDLVEMALYAAKEALDSYALEQLKGMNIPFTPTPPLDGNASALDDDTWHFTHAAFYDAHVGSAIIVASEYEASEPFLLIAPADAQGRYHPEEGGDPLWICLRQHNHLVQAGFEHVAKLYRIDNSECSCGEREANHD